MGLGVGAGLGTADALTPEAKRAGLKAVLDSETFARSDQLRSFLKYVVEMSIEGRARDVTEYLIAVEALGRPPGFSPADDSSVRSRAHELRRKLQKYYEEEDPDAAVRIELPKGSYIPKFTPRPDTPPPIPRPAPPVRPRAWSGVTSALAITSAVLLVVIAFLLLRPAAPHRLSPMVADAWGPLARPDGNVLFCIATPLHLVVRPYMAVVAEDLPKYSAPPELYNLYRKHRPLPPGTQLDMHPVDNSVQIGALGAMVPLTGVLHARGAGFQILPERLAPISAMRGRNVILVGDPQNSSAAAAVLEKTPLTIDYDETTQDLMIRDRRQQGASARAYLPTRGEDKRYTDTFGLITVLPSPGARSDQRTCRRLTAATTFKGKDSPTALTAAADGG